MFKGNVSLNVSVCSVSSCDSDRLDDDDDEIRSLCGALVNVRLLVQTKISLDYCN